MYWGQQCLARNHQNVQFSSVQFSRSVVSDSSRPHESQHARPPCPSPTPGVNSNSRPSSRWCHPAISSSVISFSSCPQSLPASASFPRCYLSLKGNKKEGFSEPSMRSGGTPQLSARKGVNTTNAPALSSSLHPYHAGPCQMPSGARGTGNLSMQTL